MKKQRGIFQKPGSEDWWIRFTDASGIYRREKAGTFAAARQLLHKRHTEATEGTKLPENLRARVTFSEIAKATIAYIQRNYSSPTCDVSRMRLLTENISGRADSIPRGKLLSIVDTLADERKWSTSTKNHHLNLLSLTYRLAVERADLRDNPLRGIRRKKGSERVRYLLPEEEAKLRAAIRSRWPQHECELDLAIHSGLRRGNMYRDLLWENVDLVGRTAIIPRTKNGERVVIPLNDAAMRALAVFRSRGNTGRVVRDPSGQPISFPKYWFTRAMRAAGVSNLRWHDLRHTFASRLRQAGVPLGNIAELPGHKDLTMTRRYAHLSISNLHEAVSRISNSTAVAPEPENTRAEAAYLN